MKLSNHHHVKLVKENFIAIEMKIFMIFRLSNFQLFINDVLILLPSLFENLKFLEQLRGKLRYDNQIINIFPFSMFIFLENSYSSSSTSATANYYRRIPRTCSSKWSIKTKLWWLIETFSRNQLLHHYCHCFIIWVKNDS